MLSCGLIFWPSCGSQTGASVPLTGRPGRNIVSVVVPKLLSSPSRLLLYACSVAGLCGNVVVSPAEIVVTTVGPESSAGLSEGSMTAAPVRLTERFSDGITRDDDHPLVSGGARVSFFEKLLMRLRACASFLDCSCSRPQLNKFEAEEPDDLWKVESRGFTWLAFPVSLGSPEKASQRVCFMWFGANSTDLGAGCMIPCGDGGACGCETGRCVEVREPFRSWRGN